jgi:GNAT superfamily N-acetyltransferase
MTAVPSVVRTNGRAEELGVGLETDPGARAEPPAGEALGALHVRPIEPADAPALQDAFEHLSPLSRYFRFHAGMARLPDELLQRLTCVDGINHVALVAIESRSDNDNDNGGAGVGVARFVRSAQAPDTAELAITVVDRAQGHGVARRLVAALAPLARERGIATFTMNVLATNMRARSMAKRLGAIASKSAEPGVIEYLLPISAIDGERPSHAA